MLGHKTNLSTLKIFELISSIFSDHNGIKVEKNQKKKTKQHTNIYMEAKSHVTIQ